MVLFFSENDLNIKLLATSWLQTQSEINRQFINNFLENNLVNALKWITKTEVR